MRKSKIRILYLIVLGLFILATFSVPIFMPNEITYFSNFQLVITYILTIVIPFILTCVIFIVLITKELQIKVERMDIGGISLLFKRSDEIFVNNTKAFLETKRTLYRIDEENDNFYETLNSYYETYQFFRNEMKILERNSVQQEKLYKLSNKVISKLNLFLTKNQNNYRRWYDYTIEKNSIVKIQSNEILKLDKQPHMMKIGEIQQYYYDYDKILTGFKEINEFFCNEVNKDIKVDIKKWDE